MIFSSVVYGHPVKYSYEIPNEFLSGLIARRCNISEQFNLRKNYFFTLLHTFRVSCFNVSQQLFFRNSSFFRAVAFLRSSFFQNSHFFSALLFSEQLLFQSETSTEKPHFENRKFFSAVNFRNSYPQNISTEKLLFRSRLICAVSTFSKNQ